MRLKDFLLRMQSKEEVKEGSEVFAEFHKLSQEALKITAKMNSKYNSPKKLRKLFSKLTGKKIDESFTIFPPFYTDCGKNISIGKNVFINSCCCFQDQAGIELGDGSLIGHNVTIATLNHDLNPQKRANLHPNGVKIGKNVWIGSDSTILPGVSIGDGAVIGAASAVTKSIGANCVAVGNPARAIKKIEL